VTIYICLIPQAGEAGLQAQPCKGFGKGLLGRTARY